jgi:hypothetical protein
MVRVPSYRSRGPALDSRRYQIFWEVVGLERGPFSLVSTTEELLARKSSGSGLVSRKTAVGIRHADQARTLSAKVGANFDKRQSLDRILRSRTQAKEFVIFFIIIFYLNVCLNLWRFIRKRQQISKPESTEWCQRSVETCSTQGRDICSNRTFLLCFNEWTLTDGR